MEFNLAHIEFYFPETQQTPQNKQDLVGAIVSAMRQWASVSYSGHLSEDDLRESLLAHLGDNSVESYTPPYLITRKKKLQKRYKM